MLKKVISLLLVAMLTLAFSACGNNEATDDSGKTNQQGSQSGTVDGSDKNDENNNDSKAELTQKLTFMGYNISYPADADQNTSDYGNLIGNSDYCVIVEAPSTAGIFLETNNINDAPALCEKYVMETLEHKIRSLFDFDSTTQTITSANKVTHNSVEMLLVEGTFTNETSNTRIDFSAIYLLAGDNGNLPVYIIGVPMKAEYDVSDVVEAIAQNIKK